MESQKAEAKDGKELVDLHFEHELWVNQLKFFKKELKIFNTRLSEVSSKHTEIEVKRKVEHFQNQFIREAEVIDTLVHDIKIQEGLLSKHDNSNGPLGDRYAQVQEKLDDRMVTFGKIWFELKSDFVKFVKEWM